MGDMLSLATLKPENSRNRETIFPQRPRLAADKLSLPEKQEKRLFLSTK